MIKTEPKKAILPGRVAVKRKQVIKTKPEKGVLPSRVSAKRKAGRNWLNHRYWAANHWRILPYGWQN